MSILDLQRRRDPDATRSAILDAAEQLFVEKGFDATSMSDIARQGNVTKSLIHHHFGTKKDLWNEVKRRRIAGYADVQKELIAAGPVDQDLFTKTIRSQFAFLQSNPEYVRLNAWTSLEDPSLSETVRPDLVTQGVERLRQAQQRGVFRQDVDAEHMVVLFLTLCRHWFMARNSYSQANLIDPDDQTADEAYLDDMLKVYFEGILPRSS